jgi:hypothetical protein
MRTLQGFSFNRSLTGVQTPVALEDVFSETRFK